MLKQSEPPASWLVACDGEFEGGFAGGVAEDGGAGKQAPAQGSELSALGLAEPALKAEKPKGDQAKFVADYQAGMKKFVELCGKLEAALKKGDNAEATKICGAMGDAQKAGHKEFKKDDGKKKKG